MKFCHKLGLSYVSCSPYRVPVARLAAAQAAVADAKAGDARLYGSPEGHFYALTVQEVVAPSPRPYDEVREQIARKPYGEKLKKNVDDYASKLRALTKVEIYLKKVD